MLKKIPKHHCLFLSLQLRSVFSLQQAVSMTLHWYRDLAQGHAAKSLCERDIAAYQAAAALAL